MGWDGVGSEGMGWGGVQWDVFQLPRSGFVRAVLCAAVADRSLLAKPPEIHRPTDNRYSL